MTLEARISALASAIGGDIAILRSGVADASIAKVDVSNAWTAEQSFREVKYLTNNLSGTNIDPANGSIQYKTLTANTTFSESLESGQSVLLAIDDGNAYTVTWPTVAWVKPGGGAVAPSLATTGYTWILLWKLGTVLYGAEVGK